MNQSSKQLPWIPALAALGALSGILFWTQFRPESRLSESGVRTADHSREANRVRDREHIALGNGPSSKRIKEVGPQGSVEQGRIFSAFRDWLSIWRNVDATGEEREILSAGLELAKERRELLGELMRSDPEAALQSSLRWDEWDALPPAIQAVSERPISQWVSQESLVSCNQETETVDHELWIAAGLDKEMMTWSYGRRQQPLARTGIPAQGFVLNGEAAIWADSVQQLQEPEVAVVERLFSDGTKSSGFSDWSGVPLNPDSMVSALMAGRVLQLANVEEVEALNSRLQLWEERPGPEGGVAELVAWLEQADGDEFVPLAEAIPVPESVNTWTETPKRLLMMRVDFDDLPGAREEYSVLLNKLTNQVSPVIDDMSFGKTNLIVTVVPEVIRMPELSTYYPAEKAAGRNANSQLHQGAQDGATALGYNMDDYDFLCVQFKSIGMGYGGLANVGGKKSWIQSSGDKVFVHEYGHNYGVGHASRWIPDPGESAFSENATSQEYGGGSSMMGGGSIPEGHFDSQAKVRLNWLDDTQWVDVTQSGRHRLYRADHPMSPGGGEVGAIRVARPDGTGDALWLGYKRSYQNRRRLSRGIQVLWQKAEKPKKNWIVPAGRAGSFLESDFELPIGQTFSDVVAGSAVHITPIERGGGEPRRWIDVQVSLGVDASNQAPVVSWDQFHANPTVFQTVSFRVNSSDPNGDELAYHWDVGDGSEVSVNSSELIHTYSVPGTFQFSVQISDMKGGVSTLNGVVTVAGGLDNWTLQTSGTTDDLDSIVSTENLAVAVSDDGLILSSGDGETWEAVDLKSQSGSNGLQFAEVLEAGGSFIAVGRERLLSGGSWEGCIYRSVNGTSWSRVHLGGSRLRRVAHNGVVWVATGDNSSLYSSANDGQTWSSGSFPASDHVQAIAHGSGLWFAMADRSNQRTWAFTSIDLQTWTEQTWASSFSNNKIARPVRWLGGKFYFGGFGLGLMTADATGQTLDANPELEGMSIYDMIEHNGYIYAVGDITEESVQIGQVHRKAVDGSWSRLSLPVTSRLRSIVVFKDRILAVGDAGQIWRSGEVEASQPSGWYLWQTQNSNSIGTDDDPGSDPFGTGRSNLFNYAVGNIPGQGLPLNIPFVNVSQGTNPRFRIPRGEKRSDIAYRVFHSSDLVSWSDQDLVIVADNDGLLEVELAIPPVKSGHFFKFEAELTP